MVDLGTLAPMIGGGMLALAGVALAFVLLIFVALYIYMALVLSTIAKKLKKGDIAWLAWVPIAQIAILPILAKKEWYWVFIMLIPIVNIVFAIIWTWNIFEQRKYPGVLSLVPLLSIIPLLGWLAGIAQLIIWGLVAWKDR